MEKFRVGIIGMGKMGLLHAAILNSLPDTKVVSMADTESFVIDFLKKYSVGIQPYRDYKEMIDKSEPDIVYITTPVSAHIPMASFCAERKIDFFIEKPLARNSQECRVLCDLVKKNKVNNMVGFVLRYIETFAKTKEFLAQKIIGEITSIRSTVYQSQSLKKRAGWRFKKEISGGGVLIDIGIHLIDLLLWYFGDIKSVDGSKTGSNNEIEDTVSATITFDKGFKSSFEASWNVENYRMQETTLEIVGEKGTIKVNQDYVKIQYHNSANETQQDLVYHKQSLYQGVPVDIGGAEYTREDLDFIRCVKDHQKPMLNVLDVSKTQSVVDAIYQSAKIKSTQVVNYIT